MRSSLALALLLSAAAPALAAERSFAVGSFDRIILTGSPDVDVRVGPAPSVVARGEPADLDRLDIRVEKGVLLIGTRPNSWNWRTRAGVRIEVSAPSLNAATINGSGDMAVDRLAGGPFTGRIGGSGDMRLPSLDATRLSLVVSGSGSITAAGTCDSADLQVSGSGDVLAERLTCRTLTAGVTGSGRIVARATETAELSVTGSGDIKASGGARCTTRTTGSGTIRCS
ncbi:MAG: head GIN domain-containing protein [Sphingomonadaceae bacterium]